MIKTIVELLKFSKKIHVYLSKSIERVALGVVVAMGFLLATISIFITVMIVMFESHAEAMQKIDTVSNKVEELICYMKYKAPCIMEMPTQSPKDNEVITKK